MRTGPLVLGAAIAAPFAASLLAGPRRDGRNPLVALVRRSPDPPPTRLGFFPRSTRRDEKQARSLLRAYDRLAAPLFAPVDAAPVVWFRGVFGAIGLWEVTRYARHGWIGAY